MAFFHLSAECTSSQSSHWCTDTIRSPKPPAACIYIKLPRNYRLSPAFMCNIRQAFGFGFGADDGWGDGAERTAASQCNLVMMVPGIVVDFVS